MKNKRIKSHTYNLGGVAMQTVASAVGNPLLDRISGGRQTTGGNVINTLGDMAISSGNPYAIAAGVAAKGLSGLVNRAWGNDELDLANYRQGIALSNSFAIAGNDINSVVLEAAQAPTATNINRGSFGWFNDNTYNKYLQSANSSNTWVNETISNALNNARENQVEDFYRGNSAFADGGGIHIAPSKRGTFTAAAKKHGKSVLEFASLVLANFARNAAKWHAFGGDLSTNGSDFTNGLTWFSNGGTHEENPYNGVPQGIAPDGLPNLVEEGEVKYNDYIFSNRLTVPVDIQKKYRLKKDGTFAEAAKKMGKESAERPNDPISKNGLDSALNDLINSQELVRMEKQAKEVKKQINKMTPEELMALQQLMSYACGGHLHALGDTLDGGELPEVVVTSPYRSNRIISELLYNLPTIGELTPKEQKSLISLALLQLDKEKKKKDWLLGKSDDYYSCGGHLHALGDTLDGMDSKDVLALMTKYGSLTGSYLPTYNLPTLSGNISMPSLKSRNPKDVLKGFELISEWSPSLEAHKVETVNLNTPVSINLPSWSAKKDTSLSDMATRLSAGTNDSADVNTNSSNSWLRYAPVVGSILGAGLASRKADYTNANTILNAANRAGLYSTVEYNPVGLYLSYRPEDINYVANQLKSSELAAARNIMNTSAGNIGAATAGLLANTYNNQIALGNAYNEAMKSNLELRAKVAEFNRATDTSNSQGALQAAMANLNARALANALYLSGTESAAKLRQMISDARDTAFSLNLTTAFDNLGDVGREAFSMDLIRTLAEAGIFGNLTAKLKAALGITTANGGKLRKKKKGLTY